MNSELTGEQTIGQGKARAVEGFWDRVGADARNSFAYGDDISDLPMLEAVGVPIVVAEGRGLEEVAEQRR
jgi:phosphoserine phosphatase